MPVSDRHFEYLAQRTLREDDFLTELKQAARAAGLPEIWIAAEQAAFLHILLRATGARHVLEIGTLAGYSAIWMARALPADGRLHTIEVDAKHADFAAEWIAKSDVADRVELHRGDARAKVAEFADASMDACFIDADKESYGDYVRAADRVLRDGGLVLVDNAFAFGQLLTDDQDASVQTIRAFNDEMAAKANVRSIIVPFGDGVWVGVKQDGAS
ncbi:MAG: O-methyltransferase [Planctomycetota bacterium]